MSKTTLIPVHDRVLLKQVEEGEKRYGSIIIADIGQEKGWVCEVLATGPGRYSEFGTFIKVQAQVGDLVLIPKIGATRTEFDNQEYFLIPDKEILCTLKKEDE